MQRPSGLNMHVGSSGLLMSYSRDTVQVIEIPFTSVKYVRIGARASVARRNVELALKRERRTTGAEGGRHEPVKLT